MFFIVFEFRNFIPKTAAAVHAKIDTIPDDASVCASSWFISHLFYRNSISEWDDCLNEDYIFIEKNDPYFPLHQSTESFVKHEWAHGDKLRLIWHLIMGERFTLRVEYQNRINKTKANPDYNLIEEGIYLIFRRVNS